MGWSFYRGGDGVEKIGPLSNSEFTEAIKCCDVTEETLVYHPVHTKKNWVKAQRLSVFLNIKEAEKSKTIANQNEALRLREELKEERKKQEASEALARIQIGKASPVTPGEISIDTNRSDVGSLNPARPRTTDVAPESPIAIFGLVVGFVMMVIGFLMMLVTGIVALVSPVGFLLISPIVLFGGLFFSIGLVAILLADICRRITKIVIS